MRAVARILWPHKESRATPSLRVRRLRGLRKHGARRSAKARVIELSRASANVYSMTMALNALRGAMTCLDVNENTRTLVDV
jgi:hypothetical protein